MHVLMVDDETEFLEIMKKRLGRRSMDITTCLLYTSPSPRDP